MTTLHRSASAPGSSSDPSKASFELKKTIKPKEFVIKRGKKYHAIDVEKAPYPLAYDPEVLDIEGMQIPLFQSVNIEVSFVPELNAGERAPPVRSLDLGTGVGLWVIHAAKNWPMTTFVGLDLVDIQVRLDCLESSLARRIQWVHSNFVSNRLPFEDGYFDHIRLNYVAKGVPEIKWISIFEECYRVLSPGGAIEFCEEDIIFPTLPRWFTAALHGTKDGGATSGPETPITIANSPTFDVEPAEALSHDYELLETLYYAVFESRLINLKPISTVPGYFNTIFDNVHTSPSRSFVQPSYRFPPSKKSSTLLQPVDQAVRPGISSLDSVPNTNPSGVSEVPWSLHNRRRSQGYNASEANTLPGTSAGLSSRSPSLVSLHSLSDHEAGSEGSDESYVDALAWMESPNWRRHSAPVGYSEAGRILEEPRHRNSTSSSLTACNNDNDSYPGSLDGSTITSWTIYGYGDEDLSFTDYYNVDDRLMFMHLWIAFTYVDACREPMWEELSERLSKKSITVQQLGCSKQEGRWLEKNARGKQEFARKKFDQIFDQYCSDMQIRLSFADSMHAFGWSSLSREPQSAAQRSAQERLIKAWEMLPPEVLQREMSEELESSARKPSRLVRGVWGYRAE